MLHFPSTATQNYLVGSAKTALATLGQTRNLETHLQGCFPEFLLLCGCGLFLGSSVWALSQKAVKGEITGARFTFIFTVVISNVT